MRVITKARSSKTISTPDSSPHSIQDIINAARGVNVLSHLHNLCQPWPRSVFEFDYPMPAELMEVRPLDRVLESSGTRSLYPVFLVQAKTKCSQCTKSQTPCWMFKPDVLSFDVQDCLKCLRNKKACKAPATRTSTRSKGKAPRYTESTSDEVEDKASKGGEDDCTTDLDLKRVASASPSVHPPTTSPSVSQGEFDLSQAFSTAQPFAKRFRPNAVVSSHGQPSTSTATLDDAFRQRQLYHRQCEVDRLELELRSAQSELKLCEARVDFVRGQLNSVKNELGRLAEGR